MKIIKFVLKNLTIFIAVFVVVVINWLADQINNRYLTEGTAIILLSMFALAIYSKIREQETLKS